MRHFVLGVAAAAALTTGAQAATIFGVDENNNLVTFDSATPGVFTSLMINGTTATFRALDFRDSNGLLYGLGSDLTLYTINTSTGFASAIGGVLDIDGTEFGFDFNTVVDMIRVVGNTGDNYVVNPDTGVSSEFTPVAYAAGDPNAGVDPVVTANAYRHGTTMQFAIDTNADFLVRQDNNAGTLTSVGGLGVAVGPRTSFDIDFDGTGYLQDVNRFYSVDLATGRATLVGDTQRALFGIAVGPMAAAVPEPGTWAMMILGFGLVGGAMRRRSATAKASRMRLTYA